MIYSYMNIFSQYMQCVCVCNVPHLTLPGASFSASRAGNSCSQRPPRWRHRSRRRSMGG